MFDVAKPKAQGILQVPLKLGLDEVTTHGLTHAVCAPWCEDCVAGRSCGTGHKQQSETKDVAAFECDDMNYPEEGFKVLEDDQNRA